MGSNPIIETPSPLNLEDVLVLINTCEKYHKKAKAISQTWGGQLKSFHYITDYDTKDLPNVVNLKISGYDQLTLKCSHMWKFVHEKYGTSKKWILKIDDDCYLWDDHMLEALSAYDHRENWYLGNCAWWHDDKKRQLGMFDWVPGPAYFLSQKCFENLTRILAAKEGPSFFLSHQGKDLALAHALTQSGITPTNLPGVLMNRDHDTPHHILNNYRDTYRDSQHTPMAIKIF